MILKMDYVGSGVTIICNNHLKGLETQSFYGMHIVTAFVTVWPELPGVVSPAYIHVYVCVYACNRTCK